MILVYNISMRRIFVFFGCLLACLQVIFGASEVLSVGAPQTEVCSFGQDLYASVKSSEVRCLQRFLNASGFPVASEGAGSVGNETDYYGLRTMKAVTQWQKMMGVSPAQGFFGPRSRAAYRVLTQKTVAASSLAVSGTAAAPVISSVTPDYITDGGTVVVSGSGFTADGNLIRYSVDPPGFSGRSAASGNSTFLDIRIETKIREKLRNQIMGLPKAAQDEIKIQFAKSISAQYGIATGAGVGYIPIDLTVRNKNGMSAPFKIYVNVIP